ALRHRRRRARARGAARDRRRRQQARTRPAAADAAHARHVGVRGHSQLRARGARPHRRRGDDDAHHRGSTHRAPPAARLPAARFGGGGRDWGRGGGAAWPGGGGRARRRAGTAACILPGPRRIKAGAARDHLLGFRAVSGRAEAFKAGGRVVKNVTGYDLAKLMAGSYGTLAALTEVTFKVLPRSEAERSLLIARPDDAAATRPMTARPNSPL